jgi:hypothetical protein
MGAAPGRDGAAGWCGITLLQREQQGHAADAAAEQREHAAVHLSAAVGQAEHSAA